MIIKLLKIAEYMIIKHLLLRDLISQILFKKINYLDMFVFMILMHLHYHFHLMKFILTKRILYTTPQFKYHRCLILIKMLLKLLKLTIYIVLQ